MDLPSDGWFSSRWRTGEDTMMITQSMQHSRTRRHGGLVRALFAAVLLAMLVMPLTDVRVGAKDLHPINPIQIGDQPVVDPGTVVDPPVVDPPLDTPTPAPTLPPVQQ